LKDRNKKILENGHRVSFEALNFSPDNPFLSNVGGKLAYAIPMPYFSKYVQLPKRQSPTWVYSSRFHRS